MENLHKQFVSANPFPHIIIDNFLPRSITEKILKEFPVPSLMDGTTHQKYEKKIASRPDHDNFPESLKPYLYALNSWEMLGFLEKLTGINDLLPDDWFYGAGLQQTMPGGNLGIHVDFNRHPKYDLDRRLNVLIYLNIEWKEGWGGEIQFWNEDVSKMEIKISPLFNRAVIFATSDISWHGLPDPIKFPKGKSRKQINLYYYTNGRDDRAKGIASHWTLHRKRPKNFNDGVIRFFKKAMIEITPPIIAKVISKNVLANKK